MTAAVIAGAIATGIGVHRMNLHPDDYADLIAASDPNATATAHNDWHALNGPGVCLWDACQPPEPSCWVCDDLGGPCPEGCGDRFAAEAARDESAVYSLAATLAVADDTYPF